MKINSQIYRPHALGLVLQLLLVNLVLVSCPVFGQVKPTKLLTAADYHLWSTLDRLKVSDDGKWVSFGLAYESGADTLFVKKTLSGKTFTFPNGSRESFNGQHFSFIDSLSNLIVHDLNGSYNFTVPGAVDYSYSKEGKIISVMRKGDDHRHILEIRNNVGKLLETVVDVEKYVCSPVGNQIAYTTYINGISGIGILRFGNQIEDLKITSTTEGKIVNPVWQGNGASLAFVNQGEKSVVHLYRLKTNKLYSFVPSLRNDWPKDFDVTAFQREFLSVSDDGKRVCFLMEKRRQEIEVDADGPQVWKSDDAHLYPAKPFHLETRIGVWTPDNNSFCAIGEKYEEVVLMAGNGRYAITADYLPYLPSVKFDSDADYYITDCDTGIKTLLLKKYVGESEKMTASPGGKYLTYFRDGDWWIYNLGTQQHLNVTRGSESSFADKDIYGNPVAPPFGAVHWSPGDKSILVYDKNDIWEISCDGKTNRRLTTGKEKGLVTRFLPLKHNVNESAYFIRKAEVIDLRKSVTLEAISEDYSTCGYFALSPNTKESKITLQQKSLKQFTKAKNKDVYVYLSQDSDLPPAVIYHEAHMHKIVYQSNQHYLKYGSSKSELIEYTGYSGEKLKGVLFFPFNYNPDTKYPMVIYIYQMLTMYQHHYQNPSLYDSEGFNITNYTSKGYFVLYPDISYELGKPGISATHCVIEVTKAATFRANIDENKIGLIGHSYGGFETDFIITQTDLFKAAVAGSGTSDLQQSYLSLSKNYERPKFWYYEYYQGRMGKSLFEDWDNYRDNSPVYHAANVNTPVLLWTGADDNQVSSSQTMTFYMALRRLNKTCTMLIYPKEGHALKKESNQIDLSNRIRNWFDHYLKGLPLPSDNN